MLSGAENLSFLKAKPPNRLGFVNSSIHGKSDLKLGFVSFDGLRRGKGNISSPRLSVSSSLPAFQPMFIQHKKEAFWFYRFLSIVCDHVINPGHWTEDMRDEALEPADLYDSRLKVVDVGGGIGFTTLGIIKHINPKNVTILDQSPHQLDEARQKEALKECTIIEGDAEDLPFPTGSVDRYISAGRFRGCFRINVAGSSRKHRRCTAFVFICDWITPAIQRICGCHDCRFDRRR